jgi:hypothetical protein
VADYYNEWAKDLTARHRRTGRYAVLSLMTGSALVVGLLLYGVTHKFDTQLVLAKVAVSVPFGVLFATLYAEANQYRREALVAANVAVQMQSVAAYTIWLDQESKDAVRRRLGEAIFVGPPTHLLHDAKSAPADAEMLPANVVLRLLDTLLPRAPTQTNAPTTR